MGFGFRVILLGFVEQLCEGAEGFCPLFEQGFATSIALFDPHPGGQDAWQHGLLLRAAKLAADGLQVGIGTAYSVYVHGQGAMNQPGILQFLVGPGDGGRQFRLGFHVVGAVHEEKVAGSRVRGQAILQASDGLQKSCLVGHRQVSSVAVTVSQVDQQHRASIGGLPEELRGFVGEAAPEDGGINAEAGQYLGHLPDVTEGVGQVPHLHLGSETLGDSISQHEVADSGLRAHQKLIGQNPPGADEQASLLNQPSDFLLLFGLDLQIVLENDGLAVQGKVAVIGVAGHDVQQLVHQFHQTDAKLFKRQVPLSIPVGVGDDKKVVRHCFPLTEL